MGRRGALCRARRQQVAGPGPWAACPKVQACGPHASVSPSTRICEDPPDCEILENLLFQPMKDLQAQNVFLTPSLFLHCTSGYFVQTHSEQS